MLETKRAGHISCLLYTSGCDYKVLVYDGKNYYTINNGTYRLNTGTYYFIVMASSMNYSDDKYYGIKFKG